MTTAIERLQAQSDRQKIEFWLDHINERCEATRAEVMSMCKSNQDARRYYVSRYAADCTS